MRSALSYSASFASTHALSASRRWQPAAQTLQLQRRAAAAGWTLQRRAAAARAAARAAATRGGLAAGWWRRCLLVPTAAAAAARMILCRQATAAAGVAAAVAVAAAAAAASRRLMRCWCAMATTACRTCQMCLGQLPSLACSCTHTATGGRARLRGRRWRSWAARSQVRVKVGDWQHMYTVWGHSSAAWPAFNTSAGFQHQHKNVFTIILTQSNNRCYSTRSPGHCKARRHRRRRGAAVRTRLGLCLLPGPPPWPPPEHSAARHDCAPHARGRRRVY